MGEVNDLRLGNLILKKFTSGRVRVVRVGPEDLNLQQEVAGLQHQGYSYIPIWLTAELMLGAGFKLVSENTWRQGEVKGVGTTAPEDERFKVIFRVPDSQHLLQEVEIESLHQLQNIYFLLTARELSLDVFD